MSEYRAPVDDMIFCLFEVAGLDRLLEETDRSDVDEGSARALLEAAARVAEGVIAPIDRDSDRVGAVFADGAVSLPPGFREAYAEWRSGGWLGADIATPIGGMGLPTGLGAPLTEMWHSGSMAFAMGLVLTRAAVDLIGAAGSQELRDRYLPRLVSGEWTATMNLSEPQAGTDLGRIRTVAKPAADGTYRLFGEKIFISYGEHDMADNIVHLVLARMEDSPLGTAGLSLFLVPKRPFAEDGGPGQRNDLVCAGIEHKLGLRGSPTCTMRYGVGGRGAIGWLVGEREGGLAAMFTMMNRARLATGLQGTAVGERATQKARAYAAQREQGRGPIHDHPDVRRTQLEIEADVMAARSIAYLAAVALDRADTHPDSGERGRASARAALLTPIVKAYGSDIGVEVASRGIQVHGGIGYVEESGAPQLLRDIRIAPIYEGTNGVQAIDLVQRKIVRDHGQAARALVAELAAIAGDAASLGEAMRWPAAAVRSGCEALNAAIDWMTAPEREDQDRLYSATSLLKLFGAVLGGGLLLKGAARCGDPASAWKRLALAFALARTCHAQALLQDIVNAPRIAA